MASKLQLRSSNQIASTLKYFDKYDFPLTAAELNFWQGPIDTTLSTYQSKNSYYFLPGRAGIVKLRKVREKIAAKKMVVAKRIANRLKVFPTIAAIFITGALAMNNTPEGDDIDLMIVAHPQTLWITRLLVVGYLSVKGLRRSPGLPRHTGFKVANKICDNLWIDTHNLLIKKHNLYQAHEIIQAKVLWDRAHVHSRFLQANYWVKDYLPNSLPTIKANKPQKSNLTSLLAPLNWLLFIVQYVYMLPRKTSEQVGLGYAFFHPRG